MSAWNQIRDNWAQIVVLAVVMGILGTAYLEWRLGANFQDAFQSDTVQLKLDKMIEDYLGAQSPGLATDTKIVTMDSNISSNTTGVANNKEEIDDNERKLEQVAAILMGETP